MKIERQQPMMTQPELPIEPVIPEIQKALREHTGAVLQAPPGAGKTTRVPLALLDAAWLKGRKILLLEPRRLAARAAAGRMAALLDQPVGRTVGYRIRMDRRIGAGTRIEVVTEGILTRMLQQDPFLESAGLIIFDEFHERSIHADTGLALCLDVQRSVRDDLRILVMSATMAAEPVAALLGQVPVIRGRGRSYPVETVYLPPAPGRTLEQNTTAAVRKALTEQTGSILVFLPGAREIRRVTARLANAGLGSGILIAPLFGQLPRSEQDRAIKPCEPGRRKVVLATSIAETSLTIEGIRVVVDAGQMRVPRFDVGSAMTRLQTIPVSKASADQRRGRAGRTQPGVCYRLWPEAAHSLLRPHNTPEIMASDLCPLALELFVWGESDPGGLAWLDPPPPAAFSKARQLLYLLEAVDKQGRVTAHGRQMADLGLHPRLAHMVLKARPRGLGNLGCRLAALLEERDIRLPRSGARDADLRLRIEALAALEQHRVPADPRRPVDAGAARRVLKRARQLAQRLNIGPDRGSENRIGELLARAYPDRIALRRKGDGRHYLLAGGHGAFFADAEPLCACDCLVVADLDGNRQNARIFLAAAFTREALQETFANRIQTRDRVDWDPARQRVVAVRRQCFGRLVIHEEPIRAPDADRVVAALLTGIRMTGLQVLPWTRPLRAWQARVLFLRRQAAPGGPWPDVSDPGLLDRLEDWLAPFLTGITRWDQLRQTDLKNALFSCLSWAGQKDVDRLAPTHLTVPSGSRIPLDYAAGEIPVLAVRLQEMFGAVETPAVAGGRVPVLLHLLSPASRPVQVTRDLAGFWQTTYFDVRRDLRGRYPKHHWPDNPLEAVPTRRTKPRRL